MIQILFAIVLIFPSLFIHLCYYYFCCSLLCIVSGNVIRWGWFVSYVQVFWMTDVLLCGIIVHMTIEEEKESKRPIYCDVINEQSQDSVPHRCSHIHTHIK